MNKNLIVEFNHQHYLDLVSNPKLFNNLDPNTMHHLWRVVLQFELEKKIIEAFDLIRTKQKKDGSWGERDSHHNFGETVVNVHRLLWSLQIVQRKPSVASNTNALIDTVARSVDYIVENHDIDYTENRTYGHGMIDRLHYLIQAEYYLLQFNRKYEFLTHKQFKSLESFLEKDTRWLISKQTVDGGWHEIDRVRSRIGTTSDAVRGINLDTSCLEQLEKGIIFIINNQNPYDGYWDAGNIDKNTDAIKALINSRRTIEDTRLLSQIDDSIDKGVEWLFNNYNNANTLEENDYDLLTVTIDYEKVRINERNVDFV